MTEDDGDARLSSRAEAQEVLRYWLAALRHEEALAARPKARRPDPRSPRPNLAEPGAGQAYFRFGLDHPGFPLRAEARAAFAADEGHLRFLERVLRAEERKAREQARGQTSEARSISFIAGWPTLHFERREELATLFRFPVELGWRLAGDAWAPPKAAARRSGAAIRPPDAVQVEAVEHDPDAGELPLSVDFGLLGRLLGVSEEELSALGKGWRRSPPTAMRMVEDVLACLLGEERGAEGAGATDPSALVAQLVKAAAARAPAGVRVYPAGLVQDASLLFATYHLQRELGALLESEEEDPPLVPGTALWSYVTGQPARRARATLMGRFRARPLTASQLEAAEATLGSTMLAVEGPPGTGKTEVILDLAAHALVTRAKRFLDHKRMGSNLLVITSTNNRAVDNVIDPLCTDLPPDRLPLALRAGSQEVTGLATAGILDRTLTWLRAQPAAGAEAALEEALSSFKARWAALEARRAALSTRDDEAFLEAHALFSAAVHLRERWAVARRESLLPVLASAREVAEEQRSLRRALAAGREAKSWLLGLFPVLGGTLLSLGNVLEDEPDAVEQLVIDEAGQCHPAFAVSGLVRAKRALFLGDVHQLPPVYQLGESDEARVRRDARVRLPERRFFAFAVHERAGTSAQALADRVEPDRPRLTDHFRCQPEIIGLSTRLFGYRLTVHTPPRSLATQAPILGAPVLFVDVAGQQAPARGSWHNPEELEVVLQLLEQLFAHGLEPAQLALLTPYVGQHERLRAELLRRGVPLGGTHEAEPGLFGGAGGEAALATGTVHRFQGGERSVVLFSTVLTETRSLPFLDERAHLLNVAISRARDHLVIVGHEGTLRRGRNTRVLLEGAARLAPSALSGYSKR